MVDLLESPTSAMLVVGGYGIAAARAGTADGDGGTEMQCDESELTRALRGGRLDEGNAPALSRTQETSFHLARMEVPPFVTGFQVVFVHLARRCCKSCLECVSGGVCVSHADIYVGCLQGPQCHRTL